MPKENKKKWKLAEFGAVRVPKNFPLEKAKKILETQGPEALVEKIKEFKEGKVVPCTDNPQMFEWQLPTSISKNNLLNLAGRKHLVDDLLMNVLGEYQPRMRVVSARRNLDGTIIDVAFNMNGLSQKECFKVVELIHKFNKGKNVKDAIKNPSLAEKIVQWVWWMDDETFIEVED